MVAIDGEIDGEIDDRWSACTVLRDVIRAIMDLFPNEQNFDLDKSRQNFTTA